MKYPNELIMSKTLLINTINEDGRNLKDELCDELMIDVVKSRINYSYHKRDISSQVVIYDK